MSNTNEAAARPHPIAHGRASRTSKARLRAAAELRRATETRLQAPATPKKADADDPYGNVPCTD